MRFLTLFFIPLLLLADNVDTVLEKLVNIKPSQKALHVDYNPYRKKSVLTATQASNGTPISPKTTELKAIFNQKAFITNSWYGIGDMVDGYKVSKITNTSVVLQKGTQMKTLMLASSASVLQIKEQ